MNRDKILKMEAGRELDVLVARILFGNLPFIQKRKRAAKKDYYSIWAVKTKSGGYGKLPFYSTDIAAAWQIAEKLQEFYPCLWKEDGYWECLFAVEYATATADTAPLAICRAALLAMEVERETETSTR